MVISDEYFIWRPTRISLMYLAKYLLEQKVFPTKILESSETKLDVPRHFMQVLQWHGRPRILYRNVCNSSPLFSLQIITRSVIFNYSNKAIFTPFCSVYRTNKYLQKSSITRVCAVGGFFISIPVFLTGKLSSKRNGSQLSYDNLVINKKDRIPFRRVEALCAVKLDCHRVKGSWLIKVTVRLQITLKQVEMLLE